MNHNYLLQVTRCFTHYIPTFALVAICGSFLPLSCSQATVDGDKEVPDSGVLSSLNIAPAAQTFNGLPGQAGTTKTFQVSASQSTNALTVELSGDSSFSIATDTCSGTSLAQSVCEIQIAYAAADTPTQGSLTVSADGQTSAAQLTGSTLTADISFEGDISFGKAIVQSESFRSSAITNATDTEIRGISMSTTNDKFVVQSDDCTELAPQETCNFVVEYYPTTFGPDSATLIANVNGNSGTQALLTGSGAGRLNLRVTGTGNVRSLPSGIDCSAANTSQCSAIFDVAAVTLSANEDVLEWLGDCTNPGGDQMTCETTLTDPVTSLIVSLGGM